jgi:hypothetical protein
MQTNKFLKAKIEEMNNFLKNHTRPPRDLYDSFIMELKVSRLFIAARIGDGEMDFEHYESDDGMVILPLFTQKSQYTGDKELYSYVFSFYTDIVKECEFDGIVINPDDDEFFVSREMLNDVGEEVYVNGESYGAPELKEIAFTVKNEELVNFISDDDNFNKYDELIGLISEAVLLNVVSSRKDLSEYARNGTLFTLEVGGFSLSVKTEGREKYALLFTSLDAIKKTCDTDAGVYFYCQITSLDKILDFILGNDLDGVILNPYLENYYVPRNVLLELYANHPEIVKNPKYLEGTYYAFMF